MKRLLSVSVTAGSDSTGRIAAAVCRGALAAGAEVMLVFGRGEPPHDIPFQSIADRPAMAAHGLATRLADRHGLASKAPTRRLIAQIESFKPDVIHLHNIHGYYLNYPLLFEYLARTGIPTVWTIHDMWPMTGHCAYFGTCDRWLDGCQGVCPHKGEYPATFFAHAERNYAQKAKYFNLPGLNLHPVGVSAWVTDIVGRSLLKSHPAVTIRNGVDTTVFRPEAAAKAPAEAPVLLGVARNWESRKGAADFVRLAQTLGAEWRVRLVGVPAGLKSKLHPRIEVVPYISNPEELAKEYAGATVFANFTYDDTCALTQLESLACGTPVVTYRTGGAPEAITQACGRVLAPGAPTEDIVAAINQAASLSSEQCRSHIMRHYSLPVMQKAYLDFFNRIAR